MYNYTLHIPREDNPPIELFFNSKNEVKDFQEKLEDVQQTFYRWGYVINYSSVSED